MGQINLKAMSYLFGALSLIHSSSDAYSNEFPREYQSAYFLGRGDTGIAAPANEESIFYNPAGLAAGKGLYNKTVLASPMIEFSAATKDVIRKISNEGDSPIDTLIEQEGIPQSVGFNNFTGILLRRAALGIFASSTNTALLYKDPHAGAMEAVSFNSLSYAGLTLSMAESFLSDQLMLGITAKYLNKAQAAFSANASEAETLNDLNAEDLAMQGTGSGADLGMLWNPSWKSGFTLGLTVKNIGDTAFTPSKETNLSASERPLKNDLQMVNIGFAIEPGTKMSKFRILLDYYDLLDNSKQSPFKKLHAGAELTVKDIVGITTGINQGYPTFGFYFDIRIVRVDLGFYTEELGETAGSRPDTRYFFKLSSAL